MDDKGHMCFAPRLRRQRQHLAGQLKGTPSLCFNQDLSGRTGKEGTVHHHRTHGIISL